MDGMAEEIKFLRSKEGKIRRERINKKFWKELLCLLSLHKSFI
jgi:hypothetical protein